MKQKSLDIAVSSDTSTTKATASFIFLKQKKTGPKSKWDQVNRKRKVGKTTKWKHKSSECLLEFTVTVKSLTHLWRLILFNYLFSFRTARNPGIRQKASSTLGKKKDTCNLLLGQLGFPGLLLFLKMQYLPLGQTWLKYELPGSLVFVQNPYFTPT